MLTGEHDRRESFRGRIPSRRLHGRLRALLRARMRERRRLPESRRSFPMSMPGRIRGRSLLDQHRRVRLTPMRQRILPGRDRQLHLHLFAGMDWMAVSFLNFLFRFYLLSLQLVNCSVYVTPASRFLHQKSL